MTSEALHIGSWFRTTVRIMIESSGLLISLQDMASHVSIVSREGSLRKSLQKCTERFSCIPEELQRRSSSA